MIRFATLFTAAFLLLAVIPGCHGDVSSDEAVGRDSELQDSSASGDNQAYTDQINQGDAFGLQGDFNTAIGCYTAAIKLEPQRAEGYAKRAAAIVSSAGPLTTALSDYNLAIERSPSDPELYLSRARVQLSSSHDDLAFADCNAALRLSPKLVKALLFRANVNLHRHDYDAAIEDYNSILAISPDFASAYCNRGVVYRAKGAFERAIADYTSAIEYNRQFADAYNNRGEVYLRQKDFDRALADLNEAIRIDPAQVNAYDNRGDLYMQLGKPELAIANYSANIDRALRLAAKNKNQRPNAFVATEYVKRAAADLKEGHANQAIADIREAVGINPGDPRAYVVRRDAFLALGETELARGDDEFAKRLERIQQRRAPAP